MDPYDNRETKRKSGAKALIITLVSVLAVLILTSAFFLFRELRQVISDSKTEQSDEISKDLPEVPESESSVSGIKTTLTHSTEIASTDDSSNGVVLMDVSKVVENVMPSVVSIVDTLEYTSSYNPYNYFFGGGHSETQETEASGTGVIVGTSESELLIVTNNHVVSNEGNTSGYTVSSKGLTITFCDGTNASAVIKGTDVQNDLAVVAVKLSDIPSETKDVIKIAVVGNSDESKVGSGVIVIGNAGGYGQSVTVGVLSAKEREVTIDNITRKLLQTDAAINPGNSGGGMFNANGELIGINCAKTVSTNIEGMGFAIPITQVQTIIESLMNAETLPEEQQGYLGVQGETIPEDFIRKYNYPAGVSISKIVPGSPAEKAGLQIYDIVTKVNGKEVTSMTEMKTELNSYPAGTTVTISVCRPQGIGFAEIEVEATLVPYTEIY